MFTLWGESVLRWKLLLTLCLYLLQDFYFGGARAYNLGMETLLPPVAGIINDKLHLTSFPGIVVFAYCGVRGFKTPCTGSHYNTWGIL